ncbi:ABC transporter permease [Parablautia sp. Marseille-Q6255]|uniref:ABC transporter permease n=1 Tax=Parablautia sp. Marseille-Q6255 TaxID=3039593 RepID=UPI0024BCA42B|nr:ABC transporter permease [Parablautia sp. Marseille-Q6255]
MYAKLVFKNAKKSAKDYLIYIVTMTVCVTLFYAFLFISSSHYHPVIGAEYNISLLAGGMKLAICGISLLLLFLIHYVNRFMLRKKQKEFAVEATLGMEQKTIGLLFFCETFFLLIFSVAVGILLGMIVSQVITAMLLASFGEPYTFSWLFFPDTVLLTVGFFAVCQILVGLGNVRILNKSRIIELMTANRKNEKPLHKSRWMPVICILYGILLLWMLQVGAVKCYFYFDSRHPLPVKLMYWGNIIFPALTLLWATAGTFLRRKIGFSRYLCGILAGAVMTAIPIFSIAKLENTYFLGFDAPTLNQYLLFGIADILFILSAVIYLSNAALLYWKESKVSRKYHNTSLFLFGQLSSKLATNTKTMTVICITLTFSICLFVIAPILTGWSLGYLDSRAVYDIQISSRYNDVYEVENLLDTDYGEITGFIGKNQIAIEEDLTFSEYLPKRESFHQRVKYDFPPLAIALTDYNTIRKMLGYESVILKADEFATHWHYAADVRDIEDYIASHPLLETDAGTLKLSENAVFQEPVGESIYNLYTAVVYIIPDEAAQALLPVQSNRFVTTKYPLSFKTAESLEQLLVNSYPEESNKDNLPSYSTTIRTTEVNRIIALNFILKASLIYSAIVLVVMCLTVLALQQLSDAEKYHYRFSVLRKMGVEEKELHTLVLKQLGVWFGLPSASAIVVAIIVISYFLQSASAEISAYIGYGALVRQIGIIIGILALLLCCYFLSTWLLFQRSIGTDKGYPDHGR